MQVVILDVLNTLCEDCNIILSNFKDGYVNYTKSETNVYFNTSLIYSNSRRNITARSLINMLGSWILSQQVPMLSLSGQNITLSKYCPTLVSVFTREICLNGQIEITTSAVSVNTHSISSVRTTSATPVYVTGSAYSTVLVWSLTTVLLTTATLIFVIPLSVAFWYVVRHFVLN